ncbi:MAG: MinD/ParA family protein [Bdellovibrio sp.]|nr:MAG: MinD/ParA family protein [Bdellovibrio sp.]
MGSVQQLFRQPTQTLSITSGKGGVGKSTIVANLALSLAQRGEQVLLLDGDLGMANLDILFQVRPRYTLEDVLNGQKALSDILVKVAPNISLIPGGSGIYGLTQIPLIQKHLLLDQVSQLDGKYHWMLIDTAPGIDDDVLYFNSAAQEILVVLTPDPSSLADAYALIKVLNARYRESRFSIICNMVRNESEALMIFRRLSDVVSRFLVVSLDYKGFIPIDGNLRSATKLQQLVVETHPRSPSSLAFSQLSDSLRGAYCPEHIKGGIQFFWQQIIGAV